MTQNIIEAEKYFTETEENHPLVFTAYNLVRERLANKLSNVNPYDTFLNHAQRVALALNNLLPPDYPERDSIVAAGLIYELSDPRHGKQLVNQDVDQKSVSLTILPSENDSLSFLERKAAMLRKIPYLGDQLAKESVLVLAVNEIDKLQMLLDYHVRLQDLFGQHATDIFLGNFPDGYSNNRVFYRELLLPEVKKWIGNESDWQSVINDLDCEIGKLEALSLLKETNLTNVDQAISSELRELLARLCQSKLPASFVGNFSIVPGRQITEEAAVFLSDGAAALGDVDLVFYSLTGDPLEIKDDLMKKIAIFMADHISVFASTHNIKWGNRLRCHLVDKSKEEKAIAFNFVDALPYFTDYDFRVREVERFDSEETLAKVIEFTVMLGNVGDHQIIGSWEIEEWRNKNIREEITALAKRVMSGEKHMNAHLKLIVGSHLFLPYCLPTIINILNNVGLGSDDGIRSLIVEALINSQAHINQTLIEAILNHTPQGVFDSCEEANEFLIYLADNLRESFGKTESTASACDKINQWDNFQDVLNREGSKASEVLTDLRDWFSPRVHPQISYSPVDIDYKKRMERNDKFSSFIHSAFE